MPCGIDCAWLRARSTADIVSRTSAPLRECVRNDGDVVLEDFHTHIVAKVRAPALTISGRDTQGLWLTS